MIIAVAEIFAYNEEGLIEFASWYVDFDIRRHKAARMVVGNIIVASSEKQLDAAIRGLPVNRTGDGLL